jgi:hypothetical protein
MNSDCFDGRAVLKPGKGSRKADGLQGPLLRAINPEDQPVSAGSVSAVLPRGAQKVLPVLVGRAALLLRKAMGRRRLTSHRGNLRPRLVRRRGSISEIASEIAHAHLQH